jgi:hypothetical protein
MIELPLTQEMIDRARKRHEELKPFDNSILKQKGRFDGFLAEEALASYTKSKLVSSEGSDKFHYDLKIKGIKVEVKAQRQNKGKKPLKEYESTVSSFSKHQKPEKYAFISIVYDHKTSKEPSSAYLKGFLDYEEFQEIHRFIPRGTKSGKNNYISRQDQWNVWNFELKMFDNSPFTSS